MRPLGKTQQDVLDSLIEHGSWKGVGRSGWVWDTDSGTKRKRTITS